MAEIQEIYDIPGDDVPGFRQATNEAQTLKDVPQHPGTNPNSPFVQIDGLTYTRFNGELVVVPDYGFSPGCDGDEALLTNKLPITEIIEATETESG